MAKIIAVCGKICSGKTYYAHQIRQCEHAVILSVDEVTHALFGNDLGDHHDEMTRRIRDHLQQKAFELVRTGCTVILDWGFWQASDRKSLRDACRDASVPCEWHYIDVDDTAWRRQIDERNARILAGEGGSDYYLDEGLMTKLLSLWEAPAPDEIDVWHKPQSE